MPTVLGFRDGRHGTPLQPQWLQPSYGRNAGVYGGQRAPQVRVLEGPGDPAVPDFGGTQSDNPWDATGTSKSGGIPQAPSVATGGGPEKKDPVQGPPFNPPGGTYIYDPNTGKPVAIQLPSSGPYDTSGGNTVRFPSSDQNTFRHPEDRDMVIQQIERLKQQGRLDEARWLAEASGMYQNPRTGQWEQTADQTYRNTQMYGQDPSGRSTMDFIRMMGFTPSGDPTLDRSRFGWQQEMDRAANTRADAAQRVSEGQMKLAADLGYAGSGRADTTLNMGRQQQAWNQGQDVRQNYRTDQELGMKRQGTMFDQRQQQRKEMIDLARNPQDYLTYAFMSGGVAPPPGVGLTDALARAGGPAVPDVDAYLGSHGMGSVRPQGADNPSVPSLEDFLNSQAPKVGG